MPVEPPADAGPAASPAALDEVSQRWVDGLRSSGAELEQCVSSLHAWLVRVARHEAARRAAALRLSGPELDDIAQQSADDAVMAIRSRLDGFRGDSRFTTWAYKFVMFEVSTAMGRHFWRAHRAVLDDDAWSRLPDTRSPGPEQVVEQRETFAALRTAIEQDLTELQRRVFVATALNEVPMDAFAQELGSSRNAVYKVLFDARRKLRASLRTAGHQRPTQSGSPT